MRIRTQTELLSLDDELDLFKEDEWQFIGGVVNTKAENYQFYNDIRDTDFDITVNNAEKFKNAMTILIIFLILGIGGVFIYNLADRDKTEYNNLMNMSKLSVEDGTRAEYVKGKECSDNERYLIAQTVNAYFNVLRTGKAYTTLNGYCIGDSSFCNQYNKYTSQMRVNYDIYDCYARALRATGCYVTVNSIDKVIKKGNKYYCYVVLNAPTTLDVENYVNTYKVNMTKYFTTNEQTDNNFYRFLLKTMHDYAMPTTESVYCFEMQKKGNEYYFVDDTQITSLCITDFTSAIAYMSILVEKF